MPNPFVEVATSSYTIAHATDPGRSGKNNEDNHAVFGSMQRVNDGPNELVQVAVVADGIGGSVSGELASQLAIDTFVEKFKQSTKLNMHDRLELSIRDCKCSILSRPNHRQSFQVR